MSIHFWRNFYTTLNLICALNQPNLLKSKFRTYSWPVLCTVIKGRVPKNKKQFVRKFGATETPDGLIDPYR